MGAAGRTAVRPPAGTPEPAQAPAASGAPPGGRASRRRTPRRRIRPACGLRGRAGCGSSRVRRSAGASQQRLGVVALALALVATVGAAIVAAIARYQHRTRRRPRDHRTGVRRRLRLVGPDAGAGLGAARRGLVLGGHRARRLGDRAGHRRDRARRADAAPASPRWSSPLLGPDRLRRRAAGLPRPPGSPPAPASARESREPSAARATSDARRVVLLLRGEQALVDELLDGVGGVAEEDRQVLALGRRRTGRAPSRPGPAARAGGRCRRARARTPPCRAPWRRRARRCGRRGRRRS